MGIDESLPRPESALIIDDDPRIAQLVAFHLDGVVEAFEFATTGEEGVRLGVEAPPDIILLDIEMPGIDGFETCRRLKDDPATRDVPIIFLTGDDEPNCKAMALDSGATDYVTKPFAPIDLQARVRAALRTKRLIDLLRFAARLDPLTGLGNRAVLDNALLAAIAELNRNEVGFAVCMLDLDHFKQINDHYGHAAGDDVLRAVGRTIASCLRPYDVAARFGGEEFVVLLRQVEGDEAEEVFERMLHKIRSLEVRTLDSTIAVTASAGLALVFPKDVGAAASPSLEGVLSIVDGALYEAKRLGRDQLVRAEGEKQVGDFLRA